MALRAFRSNPGLGGFGSESASVTINTQDCDAFAQIVKELVDNAVDACCCSSQSNNTNSNSTATATSEPKRVRVTMERFNDEDDNDDDDEDTHLLEVTVTDNGSGMQNIQHCVEAFRTTKAQSTTTTGDNQTQEDKTTGRYGIGLTLCLLHAQRLVPNHHATITSATAKQKEFTKASYVVDTDGDKVQCVKREKIPKNIKHESGTAVKLLIPGGAISEQAWPRLAEYFSRFQLSLGLQCSVEVKAPTLATIPLFVRSQQERVDKWRTSIQNTRWNENMTEGEGASSNDDDSELSGESKPKQQSKASSEINTREQIQVAASAYLRKSIQLRNVAHSEQSIRHPAAQGRYPILEVDMVVFSPNESQSDEESESDSDQGVSFENRTATMAVIRMVNRIPLLDSAEAAACGLVQGITSSSSTWKSFGLHVARTNERSRKALQQGRTFVPYFAVSDSDHVAPFFARGIHDRFEEVHINGSEDEREDGRDIDQRSQVKKRKRASVKKMLLLPAHLRIGNILLLVQINANPSTLPLPTLSKGRLPLNDESIDKALARGITDCLRSLQVTNPTLLLTSHQLKSTIRDTRYVPSVAAALACIACKSKNVKLQEFILEAAREWEQEDDEAAESDAQVALRVASLGPALERRLRLVCTQTMKDKKERKRANRKTKDSKPIDIEHETVFETHINDESKEISQSQETTPLIPMKSSQNRRKSADSWDSVMSNKVPSSPASNNTPDAGEFVGHVVTKEEDGYDDEDWS